MNTLARLHLTDEDLRILRRAKLWGELELQRSHRHPRGAGAVLDVLAERKRLARSETEEWVSIDELQAKTGQRAVHSRIAELRTVWRYVIEHNGRAGGASRYRLVDPPPS